MADSRNTRTTTDKQFAEARSAYDSGNFQRAEGLLKQIISQEPGYAGAYYYLGRLADATGYKAHAVPLFNEAVRLDPTNVTYIRSLAKQCDACGDRAAAVQALQQGLSRVPESSELGKLLQRIQKGASADEAITDRLEALRKASAEERYEDLRELARSLLELDDGLIEARGGRVQQYIGDSTDHED